MKLVRLLYYSRASREMSLSDLKDILGTARDNNSSVDVCGMLCYDKRYFLQALEGDRETVNELYLDIADDPRHDDIVIISYEEVNEQIFPQWQMGYAGSSAEFSALLKELGQSDFSPRDMTQMQAFNFLKKMAGAQSEL
ncbi:BLUF domain-containing protein [Paraglaciecola sp. 20A4]|uniref:BLUF domain-containing protein n=1 Tax=Paraglaciecola sp. 20A4 TaxID=2687288 RepID=UPI00140E1260|nr:BLUF domain-containing protein [Paraglaciecola sp. 20A4]